MPTALVHSDGQGQWYLQHSIKSATISPMPSLTNSDPIPAVSAIILRTLMNEWTTVRTHVAPHLATHMQWITDDMYWAKYEAVEASFFAGPLPTLRKPQPITEAEWF